MIIYVLILFRVTTGDNWEKVKNAKIRPFNITDLKQKEKDFETNQNKDDEYFSIQITIPNGKERILRIGRKDDPEQIAANFCKIYGLKPEIKSRLTKTITHFVNLYLKKEDESILNNNNNNMNDLNNEENDEHSYQQNNSEEKQEEF